MRLVNTLVLVTLLSMPGQAAVGEGPRTPQWFKTAAVRWAQSIGWDKKINCAVSLLAAATTYSYSSTLLHTVTTLPDGSIRGFGVAGAASGFLISWKALRKLMHGQSPLAHLERVEGAGILAGSFLGAWLAYGLVDAGAWAPMVGGIAGIAVGWKAAPPIDTRIQKFLRDTPPLDACIERVFSDASQVVVLPPDAPEIPASFEAATQKLTSNQIPFWVVRTQTDPSQYHLLIAEKLHGIRLILVFSDSVRPEASTQPENEAVIWRPLADLQRI